VPFGVHIVVDGKPELFEIVPTLGTGGGATDLSGTGDQQPDHDDGQESAEDDCPPRHPSPTCSANSHGVLL
jgi:hypothetical protein